METHGKLQVETFIEPSFQENGYLLSCDGTPDCWLVDPGFPPQTDQFVAAIERRRLRPQNILLTHCHVDHIAGVAPLCERLGAVPVICPRGEEHMLADAEENFSAGLGLAVTGPRPARAVAHGDTLSLGSLEFQVLDVSGHSPGGVAYYCPEAGAVFVGDALFAESIGRYDFHNSSRKRLLRNIRDRLLTLPPETVVYSGHGPPATIQHIKRHNMTLRWELEQC